MITTLPKIKALSDRYQLNVENLLKEIPHQYLGGNLIEIRPELVAGWADIDSQIVERSLEI